MNPLKSILIFSSAKTLASFILACLCGATLLASKIGAETAISLLQSGASYPVSLCSEFWPGDTTGHEYNNLYESHHNGWMQSPETSPVWNKEPSSPAMVVSTGKCRSYGHPRTQQRAAHLHRGARSIPAPPPLFCFQSTASTSITCMG